MPLPARFSPAALPRTRRSRDSPRGRRWDLEHFHAGGMPAAERGSAPRPVTRRTPALLASEGRLPRLAQGRKATPTEKGESTSLQPTAEGELARGESSSTVSPLGRSPGGAHPGSFPRRRPRAADRRRGGTPGLLPPTATEGGRPQDTDPLALLPVSDLQVPHRGFRAWRDRGASGRLRRSSPTSACVWPPRPEGCGYATSRAGSPPPCPPGGPSR